jgi:hypothetical protein
VYPFLSPLFAPSLSRKACHSESGQPGKKRTDRVRLRMDVTHGRLDVIVGRRVLQREPVRMFLRLASTTPAFTVESAS